MKITIRDMHKVMPMGFPTEFRVDRQSPVGNPFPLRNESERDKVCEQYEAYFQSILKDQTWKGEHFRAYLQKMKTALDAHGELELFCWCTPKRCHAETIKRYLES